jgi:dynein light intermediate chain
MNANHAPIDELIRQCTVESPERGLLLLRVRDEMRIIVAAYQVLYESSLAYAVRKGLHSEVQRIEAQILVSDNLESKLLFYIEHRLQAKKLESDKRDIERQLQELQVRAETITRRESEKWATMESRQKAELKVLRDISRDCKSKLMDALAPPKWD